ncbi:MAG: right-handed parallel beta-helix repeat-containing protein, partial [Patescibacteria group bacterium]
MNFKKRLTQTILILSFLFFFLIFPKITSAVTYVQGSIDSDTTWSLENSPYVVVDDVIVNPGATLIIEPGVVVKFNYEKELSVVGNLYAIGTSSQKIYFTSIADDEVGGDTNEDGDETIPRPEDWKHIEFSLGSFGIFTNVVIRYAGFFIPVPVTAIYNDGGTILVSRSKITLNGFVGIAQSSGSITVRDSEISYHDGEGIVIQGGTASFSNNSIHDNGEFGMFNEKPRFVVNAKNNWWGHPTGPYHPILNPNGQGDRVSDGIDFVPWLTEDPLKKLENQKPQISNLGQFKSDGIMEISEGRITTENTVVFKAVVSDPDEDKVKLQIEVKEFGQEFDGTNLLESDFVNSGSEVILTKNNLSNGQYKWRARAVDDRGGISNWQEFGEAGNIDFEVKLVPLYTQVVSNYPSRQATESWFDLDYAHGKKYSCGSKIYQCGCAITSIVMIARYYGITEAQGKDVNPKEINEWLRNEPGGYQNGNVNWLAAAKYTNWRIQYERTDNTKNNYALLDEYL